MTALSRLAGVDTKKYQSTKFTDAKAAAYYSPYAAWATVNNKTIFSIIRMGDEVKIPQKQEKLRYQFHTVPVTA